MYLTALLACTFLNSAMDEPPSHLILQADGSVRMVFDVARQDAEQPGNVGGVVRVFTESEDGSLTPGVTYMGISATGYHATKYPGSVVRAEDGSWTVENFRWSVIHGPKNRLFTQTILGSESAMILDHRNPGPSPRGTVLTWTYDHTGAPGYLPES